MLSYGEPTSRRLQQARLPLHSTATFGPCLKRGVFFRQVRSVRASRPLCSPCVPLLLLLPPHSCLKRGVFFRQVRSVRASRPLCSPHTAAAAAAAATTSFITTDTPVRVSFPHRCWHLYHHHHSHLSFTILHTQGLTQQQQHKLHTLTLRLLQLKILIVEQLFLKSLIRTFDQVRQHHLFPLHKSPALQPPLHRLR